MRFVALGDSMTQGVGDPRPGRAGFAGELDGWVTHLATAVRLSGDPIDVTNVASAGARIEHVIAEQLSVAVAARPDVVSCFIGVNDLWDRNMDFDQFAARFDDLFRRLTDVCPVVITASIHDVFGPFPMRQPLRAQVNRNVARMNEVITAVAARHELVVIDMANRSEMFTSSVKAIDRLHPNRYGHQLIAAEVVAELQLRGHLPNVAAPVARPIRRGAHDLAHVLWVGGYVKSNWRRWRDEMAAAKAHANPAAAPTK
jgi:lysophospholipase L1-like esterase